MASAEHWPEAVYLSPKRILVRSEVSVPITDFYPSVDSGSGGRGGDDDAEFLEIVRTTPARQQEQPATQPGGDDENAIQQALEQEEAAEQVAEPEDDDVVPKYLHFMLKVMYNVGLSTYDPARNKNESPGWTEMLFVGMQRLLYWTIAIIALLYALSHLKTNLLAFVGYGGITNFADVGFRLIPTLAEIYVSHLFAFQHEKIDAMLASILKLHTMNNKPNKNSSSRNNDRRQNKKCKRARLILRVLVIISVLICVVHTGRQVDITHPQKSARQAILLKSRSLGHAVFVWTTKDFVNVTVFKNIEENYGSNITFTTVALGMIRIIMEFFSNFKLDMITNMIIAAGWCLKHHIGMHAKRVQSIDFKTYNGNDNDALMSPTGDWAKYKKLKAANKAINAVYNIMLKFMHVHFMTLVAYFLMHLFDNKFDIIRLLYLVYSIAKLAIAYYIAKQSHEYNSVFQQWITDWAMQSKDVEFLLKVPAILDEMRREVLGLGTGEFVIGETFILKLIGFAGSLFIFQVDKSDG